MRARNQCLLGLTFMLVLSLFAYQRPRASDFVFGGFTDYTPMEILNKDWYDSAGLNAIAIAVDTPGTPGTGLDSLAARNWKVMATIERQSDTAHDRSWPLYAGRHSHLIHWQAEDTGSVPLYNSGVTTCVCAQGELSGQYWHIVPGVHPVTPGVADWQLREHYQQKDLDYTAIFYMKIDSIGNPGDIVARISVVDTILENGGSHGIVDSMYVRAGDFQGNGVLSPFFITYRFGAPPGPWNSNIAIDWWGTRELWLDSVVIYNPDGFRLVREDPSDLRDSVRQQALRYASTFLPDTNLPALQWWHGEENFYSFDGVPHGYPYLDFLEVAAYLDSLLSADYGQGFMCDRNLTEPLAYVGFDSVYLSRAWPQHRNYMMWCYSFTHAIDTVRFAPEPDSSNLLEVQARFDTVTQALEYSRSLTERFNADMHYVVQAWGQTAAGLGDSLRPTQSELKCLSFLGLAFAVDGLWYWPYDSGGDLYRGLLLGGDGGPWRRRHKYYTVQNYVSPIVSRFAETLRDLQRRGTGRLDTLLSAIWNPISGMVSQPMTDPYVEAGVFEDASSLANYVVLVNRNTSTTESRQLTLTIDPARLLAPGRTHYYVIDLNPTYLGQEQDTLLAGPVSGEIKYFTAIDPGGIKLLKIVPAPDRIAGSDFPARWWGNIHSNGSITVTRDMRLSAPLALWMHGDTSGNALRIHAKFIAAGLPNDPIIFKGVKQIGPHIWQGFDFNYISTPACTLSYCSLHLAENAILAWNKQLSLDHVTTTGTVGRSVDFQKLSAGELTVTGCDFDGEFSVAGGSVAVSNTTFRDTAIAVRINAAGTHTGSYAFRFCSVIDNDSVAIWICGSSGATISLDTCTIGGTKTGIFLGGRDTLRLIDADCYGLDVGIDADSGVVIASNLFIGSPYSRVGSYGIYARDGNAVFSLGYVDIHGHTGQTVGVSVGPGSRLVAKGCTVDSGYIGFEVQGDGPDSISYCRLTNNSLYGIWWNGGNSAGDSADYSAHNVISNVAATDLNVGFHVLQQSIESVGDSVKGGYNWDYNLNTYNTSGKAARITDAAITGKSGDDWGLVLNGIGATSDSAFVSYASSNDLFSQANVYVRQIRAEIDHSRFVSSGGVGSPPYGILERDATSGYVGCTWAKGQRTACVKREGSTSQLAWSSLVNGSAGNNTFYSTYAPAKLFANYGTDSVDVRLNYWGSSSGPGSRLTGPVKYLPYNTRDNCDIEAAKVAAFEETTLPVAFALGQNHPNPFNPVTTIDFSLPTEQPVHLDVFNVLGQRVRSFDLGSVAAGVHSVNWNGTTDYGLPAGSGIYFYRLTTPVYSSTKKLMFLK